VCLGRCRGMAGGSFRPRGQGRAVAGGVVAECRVGDSGCPVLGDQQLVDVPGGAPVLRALPGVSAEEVVDHALVWV
jgi:hypothetical protein